MRGGSRGRRGPEDTPALPFLPLNSPFLVSPDQELGVTPLASKWESHGIKIHVMEPHCMGVWLSKKKMSRLQL